MINPQLLAFIRQQLQLGVTKDKISSQLLANGWNSKDVEEGFSAVSVVPSPVSSTSPVVTSSSHSYKNIFLIALVIFLMAAGVSLYYFKIDLEKIPLIGSLIGNNEDVTILEDNSTKESQNESPKLVSEKDCGTSPKDDGIISYDPSKNTPYTSNPTLKCLGESLINNCEASKGFLKEETSVISLQVLKENNVCYVKLTKEEKHIQCPLSIVNTIDPISRDLVIKEINKKDPIQFAADVFDFLTFIVFVENDGDQKKIEDMGCRGDYIASHLENLKKQREEVTDLAIKAIINQVKIDAGLYFDKNYKTFGYKNFCKSLDKRINELTEINIKNTKCFDSKDEYAFSTPSTKGFFCVDNDFNIRTMNTNITGIKCI